MNKLMMNKIKANEISNYFFENTKLVNGELYFIDKFCECIEYIKTFYRFSDLDKIELVNYDNYEDRLVYTISSIVHNEILTFAAPISSPIESLKTVFYNAEALENEISQKYNISFKN